MLTNFNQFILEHKFWGKSIPDFLNYIEDRNKKTFIFIDTETTGLRDAPYEVQLTQKFILVVPYFIYNK
jgi:uncharacterized protein YprB with RNaseH-like and TPR domain